MVTTRLEDWTNRPRAAASLSRWGHAPKPTGQSSASRLARGNDVHPSAPPCSAECLFFWVACFLYTRCWGSVGLQSGLCAARSKLAGARDPAHRPYCTGGCAPLP